MLANTSCIMTECFKKSRVNTNSILAAIKVHFSGKLYNDISQKVDSVTTLLQNKEKQDSEKEPKETNKEEKQKDLEMGIESLKQMNEYFRKISDIEEKVGDDSTKIINTVNSVGELLSK